MLAGLHGLAGQSHTEACRSVRELETHHRQRRGWIWARLGLSRIAQLPQHLTISNWAPCAACFNTGGSSSYAHGVISLQECLTVES